MKISDGLGSYIPLLTKEVWREAPGWSLTNNERCERPPRLRLLLRLRPTGLALRGRSHPSFVRRGLVFCPDLLAHTFQNLPKLI